MLPARVQAATHSPSFSNSPTGRMSSTGLAAPTQSLRPPTVAALRALGVAITVLAAGGFVVIAVRRHWHLTVLGVALLTAAVAMLWRGHYAYAGYKFLLIGWWIVVLALVAAAHALLTRLSHRSWLHAGTLAALVILFVCLIGATAVRNVRYADAGSCCPIWQSTGSFSISIGSSAGHLSSSTSTTRPQMSGPYISCASGRYDSFKYRGYMAFTDAAPVMDQSVQVPVSSAPYLLTDRPSSQPPIWSAGPYVLSRVPDTGEASSRTRRTVGDVRYTRPVTTTPLLRWARPVRALSICVAMVMAIAVDAFAQLHIVPYVSGLNAPVEFVQDPSSPSVQFVVEQGGRIRVIQNGALLPTPFLDVSGAISSGGERGLLGLAFSPDYAVSRRFFVNFTDTNGNTVVARFKRSIGNPLVADPATRFDLRWDGGQRFIEQPFANHNGGHLAFGPDGFLYVGLGDGGSGDDPFNNAQRPDTLLGKLLRINVLVGDQDPEGYVVPGDNPFVDGVPIPALPEIWAFGLRNPWKFSFDDPALGGTGAMLIGDVGQNAYEEVDYQPPAAGGRNYGWRVFEGAHPYIASPGPAYLPLVGPIAEYDHTVGHSITGGFVYRGYSLGAAYRGRYFYADFVNARVWSIALIPAGNGGVTASDSHRAHRRTWWIRRHRQHQRVRRRRRGRAVHRQLLVRTDPEGRHSLGALGCR